MYENGVAGGIAGLLIGGVASFMIVMLITHHEKRRTVRPVGKIRVLEDDDFIGLKQGDIVDCYLYDDIRLRYVRPIKGGSYRKQHPFRRVMFPLFESEFERA